MAASERHSLSHKVIVLGFLFVCAECERAWVDYEYYGVLRDLASEEQAAREGGHDEA